MGKEFKSLNLHRDKIIENINNFIKLFSSNYTMDKDFLEKDITRRRINISLEDKCFYIDFHFNSDGTTTIEDFGGNHVELKKQLAYYIKDKCKINESDRDSWFVIKNIDDSDFEGIIEILLDSEYYKKDSYKGYESKSNSKIYRFKGKYNEDLIITYYETKTVQIQGKPLLLFNEAMSIFAELLESEEISKVFNKVYETGIEKDAVRERYRTFMINSHEKIQGKLKTCIHQAIYYLVMNGDMFEYSSLPLTAYRCLEGHMKYVLKDFGIVTTKHKKIGSFFVKNGQCYILNTDTKNIIINNKKIENLEKSYNQYYNIRHMLSHWDDLIIDSHEDTTELISNIEVSKRYIVDALKIIDEYYEL